MGHVPALPKAKLSAQPGTTHFLLGRYRDSEDPCPKGNSLGTQNILKTHARKGILWASILEKSSGARWREQEERKKEREQRPSSGSRSCDHFSSARPYITYKLYQRRTAAAQLRIQCPALDNRRQREQTFRSLLSHFLRRPRPRNLN